MTSVRAWSGPWRGLDRRVEPARILRRGVTARGACLACLGSSEGILAGGAGFVVSVCGWVACGAVGLAGADAVKLSESLG